MILCKPSYGTSWDVAVESTDLAKKLDCGVLLEYSGISVEVAPADLPASIKTLIDVSLEYEVKLNRKRATIIVLNIGLVATLVAFGIFVLVNG